jgi:hypothetical protein
MTREWYQLDDDGVVVVFCGFYGFDGAFRIFPRQDPKWEFCPPGTRAWDNYHQAAFLRGRYERRDPADCADLPPLPESWPPPADIVVHDPPEPYAFEGRPGSRLWNLVERRRGGLEVFVVLEEDPYETAVGDGIFYYFQDAFFGEPSARTRGEELNARGMRGHVRKGWLRATGNRLMFEIPEAERSPFDHLTLAQVCDALAGRISPRGSKEDVR